MALAEGEDTGDDAGDDDEPWPDAPEAPLTPDEQFDEIEAMYQQRAEEVPAPSLKGVATMTEACEKSEESPLAQLPATDCAPSPCPHAETVRDPLPMLDGSFVVRCVACKRPVATTSPERS